MVRLKRVRLEALDMDAGIGPLSLFSLKKNSCRLRSERPKVEGSFPVKRLDIRLIFSIDEMLKMEVGMKPDKALKWTEK